MACKQLTTVEQRVEHSAAAVLDEKGYVTAIDVLVGLGWLTHVRVEEWRQGRIPYLEAASQANLTKMSAAMQTFQRWATRQGLTPIEGRM